MPPLAPLVLAGVVLAANLALLVLQLVAGRLLAPFVGVSLETWTAVIGVFLAGIALGNAHGGRLTHRRALPLVLLAGAAATVWMMALPHLLHATGAAAALGLTLRVPLLAFALGFPAAYCLSLLTPLAIRYALTDLAHTGRVAGRVFALGTLGSLAGNFLTGFVLIPTFTLDAIVLGTAGLLLALAALSLPLRPGDTPAEPAATAANRPGTLPFARAAAVVFGASFVGLTLELSASRLLAQVVGVSLFTWTGIIGVMLLGVACGNWLGGQLADGAAVRDAGRRWLSGTLVAAAVAVLGVVFLDIVMVSSADVGEWLARQPLTRGILFRAAGLFFLPMLLLGTVTPQVIRLVVASPEAASRTAGRLYAWSTLGAIAGTFATGYVTISTIGVVNTILACAAVVVMLTALVQNLLQQGATLYLASIVVGIVGTGIATRGTGGKPGEAVRETNYYTIRVGDAEGLPGVQILQLDYLIHSWVNQADPTYLYYTHEETQMEFLRTAKVSHPARQNVLVIGGGGYTFPRCARTLVPTCAVDVVEIDPGVTAVAYSHLGLDPALGINSIHRDGRQHLAESAPANHYQLAILDAVNDLSVPYHLLTHECNQSVKRSLTPDGVYLVTVIDILEHGQLWRAVCQTLQHTFAHVEMLRAFEEDIPYTQAVYTIYASDVTLDLKRVRAANAAQGVKDAYTARVDPELTRRLLAEPQPFLRDQFAPVDNLMATVFRRRRPD